MASSNSTALSKPYNCPSLWPLDMPKVHLDTWATLTAILALITTVSNAILIYSLYKTKQLNTITNKFILLMNISDLCTGVFVLPLIVIMAVLKDDYRDCQFELAVQYIALLFAYFSFFMLLSVSIDRFIHVTKLNRYNHFMNDFRMKLIVVVSVVMSIVIAAVGVYIASLELQLVLNASDLIGVLFMFLLYLLVFRKIRVHIENFKQMISENMSASSVNREAKRELSATKTIRILLGALLILYFPYNIVSAIFIYYKLHKGVAVPLNISVAAYIAYLLVFSNAAVNAIVFSFGNSTVRRFIFRKLPLFSKVTPSETETKDTHLSQQQQQQQLKQ
eukprot:gene3623-4136_t